MPCRRLALLIQFVCLALALANAQGAANFGLVNVGTAALTQTLNYTFSAGTTLSAVDIVTTGAAGLDYTDGGGSTCTPGTAYNVNDTCTVAVAFTPLAPGPRSGAVTLFAQGSTVPLMTFYLNGVGQSGEVTIDPGTPSTIATLSNSNQAYGSAIDGAGNVYVIDHANSQVIQLAAGSFTQSIAVASGLSSPVAVALDGAGNLYISDTGDGLVVSVPNEQGTLNSADMTTVSIVGLGSPHGLATDGSGNLYVADSANGNVIEVPAGGGAPITVASGLTSPCGLAVDANGNVYVAASNAVSEYQPPFTGTPIAIGNGYNNPRSVAVDASGAVYVADTGNAQIVRVAPGGASPAALPGTGLTNPQSVTVDSNDNVYFTDAGSVFEINRTQAAGLVFANTFVGSTSAPQTVTVSNAGNLPLSVSSLATSTNFAVVPSGGADCSSGTQLSSAGECLIAVASAPALSGTLTGTVTLSDNALNNSASTQTVQLSGAGLQVAQTIGFATIPTQTYGVAPFALSAVAGSGLPVSYAVTGGPASVIGNMLTITGAGSVTVQASQAGNAQYAAATAVSQAFLVNPAATTVAWPNPSAIPYGTPLSATQLDATATPVSAGTYVYNPPSGTVLNLGSQTLSVQFTPSNSNYAPSTGSATLQVNQASQTITFPAIPTQTYGGGPLTLNATAISGLPVSYKLISGPASVSGSTLTTTKTGSVTVQASQAGDAEYTSATPVSQTFTVSPGATTVVWSNPAAITYGAVLSAKQLDATATPVSTGTYVYTPASGAVLNAGSQTLSVHFTPSNTLYSASTGSATLQVNQASQKITFTQKAPTSAQYSNSFTVAATASSGLPVLFSSSGVCTNVGATFTMGNSAGTCTVLANQAGNGNYLAAPAVTETTTASGKISPTVSFAGAPATAAYQSSFTVLTTSNSGITPTITATSACSISGNTVTMTAGAGTCTMTASWAGNNTYLAASLTQNTAAQKQATIINWAAPAPIDDHTPLSETQLDATADVVGTFVYTPTAGQLLAAGSHTLSAKFTPNSNNYAVSSDTVTLQVTARVCSPTNQTGALGPPNYGGLRSDPCVVTVGNIPSLWTNFAKDYGYTGAGTVITNPMGLKILRVTDGNTDPSFPGKAYMNNYSGGDGDQHWAIDHSMFVLGRGGVQGQAAAFTYVYLFNGSTMQATQLQNAGKPFLLPGTLVAFGQTAANAHKAWVLGNSSNCTTTGPCAILQYDLSSCLSNPASCSPPAPTTIYDFQQPATSTSPASCLYGLHVTWYGTFRVSYDDTLFTMGFSNSGSQSSGTIVAGYSVGNGCRVWNTGTSTLNIGPTVGGIPGGYVVGEFPPGAATPQPMSMTGCGTGYNCPGGADQFTLHGVDSVPSSLLGHVSSSICLAGSCCGISGGSCNLNPNPNGEYFWDFATTNAFAFGGTGSLFSGHECIGYNSLVHSTAQGQMGFIGLISPGDAFTPSIVSSGGNNALLVASGNLPLTGSLNLDTHCGWNADNANDTMPILVSTTTVCLGNQGQLHNACTPPNNKPNNGCVIPADITSSSWPSAGPSCGTGNAFTGPLVNEVLLYQTNNIPGTTGNACVTTNGTTNSYESSGAPPCSQNNILRLGNNGISSLNPNFNAQNATINWSPDGLFYTVTTDWWCTLGAGVPGQDTVCGGVDWQQNTAYSVGDIITPTAGNTANCTYTASGTPPLISGTTEPTGWSTLTGVICPAQIPATGLDGNITWVRVGAIGQQNARYDVIVGSTTPN